MAAFTVICKKNMEKDCNRVGFYSLFERKLMKKTVIGFSTVFLGKMTFKRL